MHRIQNNKPLRIGEYFTIEENSFERNEYIKGRVKKVPSGPIPHSQIVTNTLSAIHSFLSDKNCAVFFLELKVHGGAEQFFAYPDLMVICGEPQR